MIDIQNKIITGLNLTEKIDFSLDCYLVDKRRYIIFYPDTISKNSIEKILSEVIDVHCHPPVFSEWKTIIVIGKTLESFDKKDLLFFNGVNTFVCFYLINEITETRYMNTQWIFTLGLNYRKYIKKIDKILSNW